jgi:competence protein ComEC
VSERPRGVGSATAAAGEGAGAAGAAEAASAATAAALAALRSHPRQLIVLAAVGGLLVGPASAPGAVVAAALLAALAGRPSVALLVALATIGGAALADARLSSMDRTQLGPLIGRVATVEVVLLEQPRVTRSRFPSRRALAQIARGRGDGEKLLLRIRGTGVERAAGGGGAAARAANGPAWPAVPIGAIVRVRGSVERLRPWDSFQRRRGAHAVLDVERATTTGRRRGGLPGVLDAVRGRAERALSAGLAPREAALLRGMVLGQDERLSEPMRQDFRRSGLAHLLAASGQNVVLLAALALPLLSGLGLPLRARLAGVLLLIAAYVPLAGGGASIRRAGVMGAAGVLAAMAGRPASRWHAVLLAAFVTLAVDPRAAADVGWQLSFAAVISILLLARPLADALSREGRGEEATGPTQGGRSGTPRRLPRPLAETAAVSFTATLGTAPLIALHFDRVSIVSLPANLLAAPAVAPIMWLGMLSAAIGQVALEPAAVLDAVNALLLGYLGWVAHMTASLPDAELGVDVGGVGGAIAAYTTLAGAAAALARPRARAVLRRRGPPVAVVAVVVAVALWPRPSAAAPPRGFRISFLDVGQGDATLIQHGPRAILVDTGPPDGPVLTRLRDAGVRRLDALVVTHDQADHDGAAAAVLARLPVGALLDGGEGSPSVARRAFLAVAARRGVVRQVPEAGDVIRVGALRLDVLWPHRDATAAATPTPAAASTTVATTPPATDPNDRAVVLVAHDGPWDALLPADAESDVTAGLALGEVEVLKVAHHGSEDLGLPSLLQRLRPQVAVVPVGHNTYGHPTAQALRALRAVPTVRRTDRDGTVRVEPTATGRLAVTTTG